MAPSPRRPVRAEEVGEAVEDRQVVRTKGMPPIPAFINPRTGYTVEEAHEDSSDSDSEGDFITKAAHRPRLPFRFPGERPFSTRPAVMDAEQRAQHNFRQLTRGVTRETLAHHERQWANHIGGRLGAPHTTPAQRRELLLLRRLLNRFIKTMQQ